mmetsp:Transcript_104010/g.291411  ORF Transcript_104010/g.291411 Transcript_104010/m.291411 type:complete len:240 (+) Transcript_104010:153-872(+)
MDRPIDSGESTVTKECLRRGLTSSELLEDFHWRHCSSQAQNSVSEGFSDPLYFIFVVETDILKGCKSIRAHHFCPFIGVVSGRVATSENMAKCTQKAILVQRHSMRHILTGDLTLDIENCLAFSFFSSHWVKVAVEFHIHLSEVQLSARSHTGIENLLITQLLELFFGKRLSCLPMFGKTVHSGSIVAPVFHELRGEFDSVPLDTIDARHITNRSSSQHVLKTVTRFMEQGFYFSESHK